MNDSKTFCTATDAIARFKEMGAPVGEKKVRRLCASLKYTSGCGAQRIYRWADIEDAFRKSFKDSRQRLGIKEKAQA